MKNCLIVLFILAAVVCVHSGVLKRNRRGFLSRTGICPIPSKNPTVADVRLNYLGNPIILEKPDCARSECTSDSGCDGDQKCCANRCGAKVCTSAVRDPEPCKYVRCPQGETCKVRKVKCVMPDCESGDVPALGQPTCIKDPNAPKTPPHPAAPSAPQASAYQTPTYATTYPGCISPPCQAPMPAPAPMMPMASAPAPVMFADDQSQSTPLMPEEPQQEIQQPQMDMQQPQMDMQQPQMDMQQPAQEMQQPQQAAQPQEQDSQPQENAAEQNAPLQDLDEPNNNQQQQQQQPQVQPMYPSMPQQVVQQQYQPQTQWDKKHKRHAQ